MSSSMTKHMQIYMFSIKVTTFLTIFYNYEIFNSNDSVSTLKIKFDLICDGLMWFDVV